MIEDKHIRTLQDFGLSYLQAKTYLVLLDLGEADTKTIARASNVARQEIYRVMPSLQKLGLSEKSISKPIIYKATPLKDALSILLKKEKTEVDNLQNKQNWLLNNFHSDGVKNLVHEDDTQFIITSELTLFFNSHEKLLSKTQESIDIIVPFIFFPEKFCEMWSQLKKTMLKKRNLKVRLIAQRCDDGSTLPKSILEYPDFELRYATEPVSFGMYVFDKKELTLAIAEKSGLPSLWSNNHNMLILAQNYYELMWAKAVRA